MTILAGNLSAVIDVTGIVDDSLVEADETVIVTLTGVSGDPQISLDPDAADLTATVTIADNDSATVSIAATDAAANETPTNNGQFTVSLTQASSTDTVVSYALTGSTATPTTDYTALTGSVTILAGNLAAVIDVAGIVDDSLVEAEETVIVTLTGVSGDPQIGLDPDAADLTATVTIADNDSATVSIAATDAAANETPINNGQFTVSLTQASATNTVVSYALTGSTATPTTDYTALTGSVTILAGNLSAVIDVTGIVDDSLVEAEETVIVTLTGVSGDPQIGLDPDAADLTATVTIADNDSATASIAATDATAHETPINNGQFTVSLTQASATNTVVSYALTGSTATPTTDYTALTGSVTILAGNLSAVIDVAGIVDDSLVEAEETVIVTLTGVSGDPQIGLDPDAADLTATVTIADNDDATVSIAATDAAANETPTNDGQFTVSLTQASSTDTVVSYALTGSTATPTTDYAALTGSVTILAGNLSAVIDVTGIVDDSLVEAEETVIVTLTGVSGDPQISLDPDAADLTATVTIADNDGTTVSVTGQTDAAEPATNGAFRFELSALSSTATIVTYSVTGTATTGTDYSALTGTVTIPALTAYVDVSVAVLDDLFVEGTETVFMVIDSVSGAVGVDIDYGNDMAEIDIADNDTILVSIVNDGDAAEPGTHGGFMVSLTQVSSSAITVAYTVTGTASSGVDYAPLAGLVTIPAFANSVDIPVSVIDDLLIEGTELVTVTLTTVSGPAGVSIDTGADVAAVEIDDNDQATISIAALSTASQAEGDVGQKTFQFQVTLDKDVPGGFTVAYNTNDGTAFSGTDYVDNDGTITFVGTAGEQYIITVLVNGDQLAESNETFTVVLGTVTPAVAPASAVTVATGTATGTIVNDDSAPVADINGPYSVTEGGSVSLSAGGSTDADSLTLTYSWDIDNDGDYDEGVTGLAPTLSWTTLATLGLDDGTVSGVAHTIRVLVSDGPNSATATTTLTVFNAPPSITTLSAAMSGLTATLTGVFSDPSVVDDHDLTIDWGDGNTTLVPDTSTTLNVAISQGHTYAAAGAYVITVTVTDDDGGSDTEKLIAGTGSVVDSGVLYISGGDDNDQIIVTLLNPTTVQVSLKLGAAPTQIFTYPLASLTQIQIRANGGHDVVNVSQAITLPTSIDGGAGNDNIRGGGGIDTVVDLIGSNFVRTGAGADQITTGSGNDYIDAGNGDDVIDAGDGANQVYAGAGIDTVQTGAGADYIDAGDGDDLVRAGAGNDTVLGGVGNDILLGEGGDDTLNGGDGLDLLIGGTGADGLNGGAGNDILVGGTTAQDANDTSLKAIRTAWATEPNYLAGVAAINPLLTAIDDGSADGLTGGSDRDVFFRKLGSDIVTDAVLAGFDIESIIDI